MKNISVIIPVYNSEKFIARAIDSVLSQTVMPFEIIIVNDGATDSSGEIINSYAKNNNCIKVIAQKNMGIGAARNAGIFAAKGGYIAFLDSDDKWNTRKIEVCLEYIEKHSYIDLFYHSEIEVFENGEQMDLVPRKLAPDNSYRDLLLNGCPISTSAVVVRTMTVQGLNGFSTDMVLNGVEDYDMWLRILNSGAKAFRIEENLGYYYKRSGSISSNYEKHFTKTIELLNRNLASGSFTEEVRKRRIALEVYIVGLSYYKTGDYRKAKSYFFKSINQIKIKSTIRIIQTYYYIIKNAVKH